MVERVLAMECGRSRSPSLHLTWHASYRCFAFYEWFDYFTGSDDMSYCPPWLYRAADESIGSHGAGKYDQRKP